MQSICGGGGGGDAVSIAYRKQSEPSHSYFSRRQVNFAALALSCDQRGIEVNFNEFLETRRLLLALMNI